MIRLFLIAGVFIFLSSHAEAASFDCKKAKSEVEKVICSDENLSDLDERIAAAYHNALSKLSPEGQRILRDGQRRWLKTLPKGCYYAPTDLRECLERAYRERLGDLSLAAVRVGKYLFSRVDLYDVTSDMNSDGAPNIYNYHSAYPRIDSPVTAETRQWNLDNQQSGSFIGECEGEGGTGGSEESGYSIEQTGKTSLQFTFFNHYYCNGMAHGQGQTWFVNVDVARSLGPLIAVDLFNNDTEWQDFLVQRSLEKLKHEVPDVSSKTDIVKEVVSNSENWAIDKKGLLIIFASYTIDGYPSYDVLVPWADLKPYLRPDAPIPR